MPPSLPLSSQSLLTLTSRRAVSRSVVLTQCRHATLIRRPLRPYTFTQLVTLSDGSTALTRTTSPLPVYKSLKDTRNHPMWNPSSQKLADVEQDEAGRLKAFRRRFGRGWDAEAPGRADQDEGDGDGDGDGRADGKEGDGDRYGDDGLMDLISGYGAQMEAEAEAQALGKQSGEKTTQATKVAKAVKGKKK